MSRPVCCILRSRKEGRTGRHDGLPWRPHVIVAWLYMSSDVASNMHTRIGKGGVVFWAGQLSNLLETNGISFREEGDLSTRHFTKVLEFDENLCSLFVTCRPIVITGYKCLLVHPLRTFHHHCQHTLAYRCRTACRYDPSVICLSRPGVEYSKGSGVKHQQMLVQYSTVDTNMERPKRVSPQRWGDIHGMVVRIPYRGDQHRCLRCPHEEGEK